jgi:hypothetical protein
MGHIDNWKMDRQFAWQIAVSSGNYKNLPTPEQMFPLPGDEPEESTDYNIEEFYNNAIK